MCDTNGIDLIDSNIYCNARMLANIFVLFFITFLFSLYPHNIPARQIKLVHQVSFVSGNLTAAGRFCLFVIGQTLFCYRKSVEKG